MLIIYFNIVKVDEVLSLVLIFLRAKAKMKALE